MIVTFLLLLCILGQQGMQFFNGDRDVCFLSQWISWLSLWSMVVGSFSLKSLPWSISSKVSSLSSGESNMSMTDQGACSRPLWKACSSKRLKDLLWMRMGSSFKRFHVRVRKVNRWSEMAMSMTSALETMLWLTQGRQWWETWYYKWLWWVHWWVETGNEILWSGRRVLSDGNFLQSSWCLYYHKLQHDSCMIG